MNDSYEKEVTILTQDNTFPITPIKSKYPLSINNNHSPTTLTSPKKNLSSPLRRKHNSAGLSSTSTNSHSHSHSPSSSSFSNHEDFKNLQRSFADSLLNYNNLQNENKRLEIELLTKKSQLENQSDRIKYYEDNLKQLELDHLQKQDILNKQLEIYKEKINNLEFKIFELTQELEESKQHHNNIDIDEELITKYQKLLRDYKILDSQFEVEKNSKLVLMDQIEFLAHKNEDLIKQLESPTTNDDDDDNDYLVDFTEHTHHSMNELTDDDDDDDYTEGDSIISAGLNIFKGHSSPIKKNQTNYDDSNSSVKVSHPPTFPPSPEPDCKEKRQSLPTQLKTNSPPKDNSEFVLSPFKLTASHSFTEDSNNYRPSVIERYSSTKPTHSRYNSHDIILPIKVEFEKHEKGLRTISVPERSLRNPSVCQVIEECEETAKEIHRNGTLFALSGLNEPTSTNNNNNNNHLRISKDYSEESSSLSKRSSYITSDEKTRQELTKLKFELQSLKLHNEKLLSFIGFELQKQKNNIKKLSKKQSQRSLTTTNTNRRSTNNIEYSDAKLIERSRDVLINKKRVLRCVSINTGFNDDRFAKNPTIINKLGLLDDSQTNDEGLMDLQTLTDGSNNNNSDKMIKKFASQVFDNTPALYGYDSDSDFDNSTTNWEGTEEEDEEEDEEELSSDNNSSQEEIGVFNQIKNLVIGGDNLQDKKLKRKKSKNRDDHLVDDTLKFKFLTIALGIIIIGIKLTPQSPPTVTR
ncbi:hypothetical protein SBY92_002481 [Candida maltosa Xu316]